MLHKKYCSPESTLFCIVKVQTFFQYRSIRPAFKNHLGKVQVPQARRHAKPQASAMRAA